MRIVFIIGSLVACEQTPPTQVQAVPREPAVTSAAGQASADVAEASHFGAPFSVASTSALAAAAAKVDAPDGEGSCDEVDSCGEVAEGGATVRVTGTVDAVCQKAGCWMVLKDGDIKARIFIKDHAFFLPRDAAGRSAVVEGTLRAQLLSQKFGKHLAEDSGENPDGITGPRREYIMTASAVELR